VSTGNFEGRRGTYTSFFTVGNPEAKASIATIPISEVAVTAKSLDLLKSRTDGSCPPVLFALRTANNDTYNIRMAIDNGTGLAGGRAVSYSSTAWLA
jgi:hypothetical protein